MIIYFNFAWEFLFNTFIHIQVVVQFANFYIQVLVQFAIHLSAFFEDLIVVEDRSLFSQSSEIFSSLFNNSKNFSKKIDS